MSCSIAVMCERAFPRPGRGNPVVTGYMRCSCDARDCRRGFSPLICIFAATFQLCLSAPPSPPRRWSSMRERRCEIHAQRIVDRSRVTLAHGKASNERLYFDSCLYVEGVTPSSRLKMVLKCAWSAKPQMAAMWVIDRSDFASRF